MWIRRIVALAGLTVVLGCSGLSSLFLENRTERAIAGTITMEQRFGRERPRQESMDFRLGPGEEVEALKWFDFPPDWIELKFDSGSGLPARKFRANEYSPAMARGTSGGAYFFLEVGDGGYKFRDPNTWDKMRRNPQYYLLLGACFGVPILIVGAGVFLAIRSRKRGASLSTSSKH